MLPSHTERLAKAYGVPIENIIVIEMLVSIPGCQPPAVFPVSKQDRYEAIRKEILADPEFQAALQRLGELSDKMHSYFEQNSTHIELAEWRSSDRFEQGREEL
jgi:hypothetical protein